MLRFHCWKRNKCFNTSSVEFTFPCHSAAGRCDQRLRLFSVILHFPALPISCSALLFRVVMFQRRVFVVLTIISAAKAVHFCEKNHVLVRDNSSCIPAKLVPSDQIFNKCCPLDYVYDKGGHSCVYRGQQNRFNNHTFFKIGIGDCVNAVVKDHYVTKGMEFKKYGNGMYCVDEVYNSEEIVVRKCTRSSSKECRVNGGRCLRKCCPDHEVFVQGPVCTPKVNVTFNYANWTNKIHVLKGTSCLKKICNSKI